MKDTTSRLTNILRASLPQNTLGKILSAFSVVIPIVLYLGRVGKDTITAETFETRIVDFGFAFCLITLMGLLFLFTTIMYACRPKGHPLPLVLFLGAVLCAWFLPVPPTAEEAFFSSNRAGYEELVRMVRDNQLYHSDECASESFFVPPAGYEPLLGSDDCVYVPQQQASRLVVELNPLDSCRPIIYFQKPTMVEHYDACDTNLNGRIFKQLAEHWYICEWHRCH